MHTIAFNMFDIFLINYIRNKKRRNFFFYFLKLILFKTSKQPIHAVYMNPYFSTCAALKDIYPKKTFIEIELLNKMVIKIKKWLTEKHWEYNVYN